MPRESRSDRGSDSGATESLGLSYSRRYQGKYRMQAQGPGQQASTGMAGQAGMQNPQAGAASMGRRPVTPKLGGAPAPEMGMQAPVGQTQQQQRNPVRGLPQRQNRAQMRRPGRA